MKLLLDTHALIWWAGDSENLGDEGRRAIEAADAIWISAVSVYEMSLKHQLGKLPGVADLLPNLDAYLDRNGFKPLTLALPHADLAGRLPPTHRDPFDRMLAAQALVDDLTLISNDTAFDAFGVRRLW